MAERPILFDDYAALDHTPFDPVEKPVPAPSQPPSRNREKPAPPLTVPEGIDRPVVFGSEPHRPTDGPPVTIDNPLLGPTATETISGNRLVTKPSAEAETPTIGDVAVFDQDTPAGMVRIVEELWAEHTPPGHDRPSHSLVYPRGTLVPVVSLASSLGTPLDDLSDDVRTILGVPRMVPAAAEEPEPAA